VDDPPGVDCLALDVRQQREFETKAAREARGLLDGVDRDRDDLGAGGIDF
jgi:hypothetical protein